MHFVSLLDTIKIGLEELLEARVGSSSLLDEGYLVADTEAILEEERAAEALKSTLTHDSNTIAEHVGLVHVMCRQHNNSVLLVRLEHVPEIPSGAKIHA